jgi:phosphate transport system protein
MKAVDDNEMETIRRKVLRTGELVKRSVQVSMDAIMSRDAALCDRVDDIEKEVDFLNVDVEDSCIETLSSNRLAGKDLRFVAMFMNISARFERMTDLTSEICGYCKRGLPKPLLEPSVDLQRMSQVAQNMIDINLKALSEGIAVSIEELTNRQNNMKNIYEVTYGNLVSYVHRHPESFDDAMLIVRIVWNFLRIGELAIKIGNRIIYVMEGRRIWIGQ